MFIQLTAIDTSNDSFKELIGEVKNLYWPKDQHLRETLAHTFKSQTFIDKTSGDEKPKNNRTEGKKKDKTTSSKEDLTLEAISDALDEVSKDVSKKALYKVYFQDGTLSEHYTFPFLSKFYRYFFTRKWDEPYYSPKNHIEEFLHLHPPGKREGSVTAGTNYSLNVGNYHHFVNVVAALARLVRYFSDEWKVRELFEHYAASPVSAEKAERLSKLLVYGKTPTPRKLMLLIAGFYHDIGKTVTNPRHGMEGAIMFAFHTTHSRHYFNQIVRKYKELGLWHEEVIFKRAELFYISNLILFHDQYGTIQTGEDSYLRLADMITELATYADANSRDTQAHADWTMRYLFDLWLLNIADIMVSVENKWEPQDEIWLNNSNAEERIRRFFGGQLDERQCTAQGTHLINDLVLSMDMVHTHFSDQCTSDPALMEQRLYNCSRHHSLERIRRLITAAMRPDLTKSFEELFAHELAALPPDKEATDKSEKLDIFMASLVAITDQDLELSIIRAVQSVSNIEEFCRRLAWIGKMDYALGFFQKLSQKALKQVGREILDDAALPTGWIRKPSNSHDNGVNFDNKFMGQVQAQFFFDNFAAVVIQILGYLLLREESIDRIRNIQFSDAAGRLTDDKLPKLLSLDGPFRAKRVTQLILQTIYVY